MTLSPAQIRAARGLLDWTAVEARLVASRHYWMATVRPDGRPHVVPRWGVWLDNRLYYDGSPATIHAGNLRHDGRCVLHLEDGEQAVVVEGVSAPSAPVDADLGARISAGFAKYAPTYEPGPDSWSDEIAGGLCVFTPHKAMAWTTFPNDVTRFRFAAGG